MILKLMSDEEIVDSDSRKCFRLFDKVDRVAFVRGGGGNAYANIEFEDGESLHTVLVTGGVYLMNDSGKTVASFGATTIRG